MDIRKLGNGKTITFACSELVRYLKKLDSQLLIQEKPGDQYEQSVKTLWVGCAAEFETLLPEVQNKQLDDGIYIGVVDGVGIITGTNSRSVLIAVYRFLKELGIAWVRPGADGEILPKSMPEHYTVQICEAASYRHRAICIEGAVSREHVMNMVDWIPKASMNGYFIQFQIPFIFFDRWYSHRDNPMLASEPITSEEILSIRKEIEEEIELRGLMYHAAGHGWTCEPFGVQGLGWDMVEEAPPESIRQKLAMVNGVRDYWDRIPLNTNLCYSDPVVQETMSDAVVDYCKSNPEMDYVHVWLADGSNNHCECNNCKDTMPSELYIQLLNNIDEKLSQAGIATKIVFLLYLDLLWVNKEANLHNPDRFVMMFAPITRSYTSEYVQPGSMTFANPVPYVRNKLVFPKRVEENLAYLRGWQEIFEGDSLDFDYHLMWDHLRDPGYYRCAEVLFRDVTALDELGLNGYISCQLQRASFPTGLPLEMMAQGLWNKNGSFEHQAKDYFAHAFGENGEDVRLYLKKLSEQFVPPYIRGELGWNAPQVVDSVRTAKTTIQRFEKTIHKNLQETEGNVRQSWCYLQYHAAVSLLFADVVIASAAGDDEEAKRCGGKLISFVQSIESCTHTVLDTYHYIDVLNKFLRHQTVF